MNRGWAGVLASAAAVLCAGCEATAHASHPTATVVRVPDPARITEFDLAAYVAHDSTSRSASRLLSGCLDRFTGSVVQVAVQRSLSQLGVAGHGTGIGIVFQSDATSAQRDAVATCLLDSGAHISG